MNDKVKGHDKKFMNCHLSEATQRSHSCKKIPSTYTGTVLSRQTEVLQLFLILLLLKRTVLMPVGRFHIQTKTSVLNMMTSEAL